MSARRRVETEFGDRVNPVNRGTDDTNVVIDP